ncbi:hypothetical protein [Allobranchiibius sp. CTAmp26]|uniref:DUF6912 family protein n=1 Tax=Allobranchiibius sp. CTAmp26 TaxID=2815214 RepID=UPI001AA152AC|nr:hypothetical protein [Allobranchiibius sp. CTAmp26]MBO1755574.1 hypothetical protein [Allobranchiibius sp. CTAmp26]
MKRVYLPLTGPQLQALRDTRRVADEELVGFSVTTVLIESLPASEDVEGHEYAALQEAALESASRGGRVVVAADVDDEQVQRPASGDEGSPGRVIVHEGLDLRRVVSLQVLDPAGERDPDSDLDLSWYDVTELADLLAELGDA